jgi:MYXO-CTERM domain-containing protein
MPAIAEANTTSCMLSGTSVVCATPVPCMDDAQCFVMNDERCALTSSTGGTCARDCNTIFTCAVAADCPITPGLTASCHASTIPNITGLCEYAGTAASRMFVNYCTSGAITFADVMRCYGTGDRWNAGDCDQDGLPNGTDATPCTANPTGLSVEAVPSPFCLHDHLCEGLSSVCAPLLHCATTDECGRVATSIGATTAWECSALPGTGTETYCHPSCFATAHCSIGSEPCDPRFGACTMASANLDMCLPMALSTCESNCASMPLSWASAQGDCDGDGAQNGCDPNPCRSGDAPCLFNHMCSIDAGVDGGGNTSDAGSDAGFGNDAFVTVDGGTSDAGVMDAASADASASVEAGSMDGSARIDAGGQAVDAGLTTSPGLGFSGGGGCRCGIAERHHSAGAMTLLGLVALAMRRRRQR